MTITGIDVNAMYASTKIKNRQGKSIKDLPVAKSGHILTLVAESQNATTNAAGIWLNGVSMMCVILSVNINDKCSHLCGSFRWGGLPRGGSGADFRYL